MRSFEERKAEVFCRSEKRIRIRKRMRNSIIALCLPFGIAVAIFSVKFLPKLISLNDIVGDTEITEESYEYEYAAGIDYCSLEISHTMASPESSKNITDKASVENIYNTIQSIFLVDGNSNGTTNAGGSNKTDENFSVADTYILTFTADDGFKTVYTLNGNTLICKTNRQITTLTDKQLKNLKKLLGF